MERCADELSNSSDAQGTDSYERWPGGLIRFVVSLRRLRLGVAFRRELPYLPRLESLEPRGFYVSLCLWRQERLRRGGGAHAQATRSIQLHLWRSQRLGDPEQEVLMHSIPRRPSFFASRANFVQMDFFDLPSSSQSLDFQQQRDSEHASLRRESPQRPLMRLRRLHPAGHCVLLVSASLPALPEIHRRVRLVSPLDKDADKFPSRGDVKRGSEARVGFVGSSGVAVRQDAGREAVRAEAANACAWRAWQRAFGWESSLSSSFRFC